MARIPSSMVELANSKHQIPAGATALRRTNGRRRLELTLGVRRMKEVPDLSALDNVLPKKRKYMTRVDLREAYGSDAAAVAAIQAFASAHHLTVTRDDRASARIGLAGTVADLSAAFGVTLFDYTHPELGDFHARTGAVQLATEIAGEVTGVFGFTNHRIMKRELKMAKKKPDTGAAARPWFIPAELAGIYNFPSNTAAGQCVAILEFGGGVETADVTKYFAKIKLPAPTVKVIAIDGVSTDPEADPDSTGEVMLDIDMAGCLATNATIAAYFSTFDEKGLVDVLGKVVEDSVNDPSVVSISWGWPENQSIGGTTIPWSLAAIVHCNESFLAAAHLGITVCVSTGDDGSEAQIKDGRAHVNFPASSPYVLAVGGTTLHVLKDSSGKAQLTEVVWNDGPGSGTGGGVSDDTAAPTWQSGKVPLSINPGHFAGRAIPDVAANADPDTGYLTMSGGKLGIVGGTSASAPLWASLISRINVALGARVGNFNALLYTTIGPAGTLRDITVGDNDTDGLLQGQYAAAPGWDACTGWGSPDGNKLLQALK